MSRLIDADDLSAKMYHEAFEVDSDMQKWDSGCWIRYKMFEKNLEDSPTIEPEPHWIPCSKEPPPQHQEIWITDVYGDVEVVYRGDGILWHSNGDNGYYFEDEIIAWMPASVPEPYQPEEESE